MAIKVHYTHTLTGQAFVHGPNLKLTSCCTCKVFPLTLLPWETSFWPKGLEVKLTPLHFLNFYCLN